MPSAETVVLWVDDDAPAHEHVVDGIRVLTARSLDESEQLLARLEAPPRWVIIDLVVPQGSWGEDTFRFPGLEYLEYLRERYAGEVELAVYTMFPEAAADGSAWEAGASHVFYKAHIGLTGVLDRLLRASGAATWPSKSAAPADAEEAELGAILRRQVSELEDRMTKLGGSLTDVEAAQLHTARVALTKEGEARARSLQTLAELRAKTDGGDTESPPTSERGATTAPTVREPTELEVPPAGVWVARWDKYGVPIVITVVATLIAGLLLALLV